MADRLANYVPVAERIAQASADIQTLITEPPVMLTDVLGYIRVTIALIDGRTATGLAQFRLDATKGAQATNPLEDAETSAVGRALAFLGWSANRGIASREDVQRARQLPPAPSIPRRQDPPADPERAALIHELGLARAELHELSPQALGELKDRDAIKRMNLEQLRYEIGRTRQILGREQGPPPTEAPLFDEAA